MEFPTAIGTLLKYLKIDPEFFTTQINEFESQFRLWVRGLQMLATAQERMVAQIDIMITQHDLMFSKLDQIEQGKDFAGTTENFYASLSSPMATNTALEVVTHGRQ